MTKEDSRLLNELINHPGWTLIDRWFEEKDKEIITGVRKFITVPDKAEVRWMFYYSGMIAMIEHFKGFIKNNAQKAFRKVNKEEL